MKAADNFNFSPDRAEVLMMLTRGGIMDSRQLDRADVADVGSVKTEVDLPSGEITHLLRQWQTRDDLVLEQLIPLVYEDLRRMARFYFRKGCDHKSLQATELVHEVFVQLQGSAPPVFENRQHFFALAGRMMRQTLMRYARVRKALKRGGSSIKLPFDEQLKIALPGLGMDQILTLDQFLTQLGELDPRKLQILEWQFFLGLESQEIAEMLGLSVHTVQREFRSARVWLVRALRHTSAASENDQGG